MSIHTRCLSIKGNAVGISAYEHSCLRVVLFKILYDLAGLGYVRVQISR